MNRLSTILLMSLLTFCLACSNDDQPADTLATKDIVFMTSNGSGGNRTHSYEYQDGFISQVLTEGFLSEYAYEEGRIDRLTLTDTRRNAVLSVTDHAYTTSGKVVTDDAFNVYNYESYGDAYYITYSDLRNGIYEAITLQKVTMADGAVLSREYFQFREGAPVKVQEERYYYDYEVKNPYYGKFGIDPFQASKWHTRREGYRVDQDGELVLSGRSESIYELDELGYPTSLRVESDTLNGFSAVPFEETYVYAN